MSFFNWVFGQKKLFIGGKSYSPTASFSGLDPDIQTILKHPVLTRIFSLQCDLFSLGKFQVKDNQGNFIDNDPFLKLIEKPNLFEDESEFLWVFMFNLMLGNSYIYANSRVIDNSNLTLSILENDRVEIDYSLSQKSKDLLLTRSSISEIERAKIKYWKPNGSTYSLLDISNVLHISDFHVNSDSKLQGSSKLKSLEKIISNSEASLDSENINIRYAGKFLVSGTRDPEKDLNNIPLTEIEKRDIESKVNDNNPVRAIKSPIDIKRYVENAGQQKLGEKYRDALQATASVYNIPRDVIEAYQSSTYENQEQARASHVVYTLQPKGDMLAKGLSNLFGYNETGKKISISWDHLPFMNIFKESEFRKKVDQVDTAKKMIDMGMSWTEVNRFLGTNFEE